MIDILGEDDEAILEARANARLGSVLRDKYRLERVLGIGGMATVYAATHRNGAEVALKLLHPELAHHPDVRTRFLREGYVANQVKHAGAVSVIDDDVTEEGWAFLVMELLQGVTLQDLWEERGLRVHPAWVTAITLQLLEVMAAAHECGIIHRDLKPANLFVTREGELKVLDFGIARMRDVSAHTTVSGSVLGTPAFMAPEQAMAQSKEIDQQTDLWAIGSVAFALLSGEVVHPAENTQQTLILAATTPARALAPLARDVTPGLAAVVERALAFRKADRWTTATEMREALVVAAREAFGTVPDAAFLRDALGGRKVSGPRSIPEATIDLPSDDRVLPSSQRRPPPPGDRATLRGLVGIPGTRKKARKRDVTGAALLGFAVLAGLILIPRLHSPGGSLAAAQTGALAQAADSAATQAPSPVALTSDAEPVADPTPSSAALVPTDATAEPELASPPSRSRDPRVPTASSATITSAAISPAAISRASGGCTPPFVIDPRNHRKRWKLECL
jgi:serine/threonine protein kinase